MTSPGWALLTAASNCAAVATGTAVAPAGAVTRKPTHPSAKAQILRRRGMGKTLLAVRAVLPLDYEGYCKRSISLEPRAWLSFAVPVVVDDVLPFGGVRAGDDGHHRLGVAQVEHLVGDAGLDEDEIARLVLHRLLQAGTVLVADPPLEDVEHHLEVDVDVGVGHAARRDGGDVHRQLRGVDVLGREAGLVLDVVPAPAGAARADHGDPVVAF